MVLYGQEEAHTMPRKKREKAQSIPVNVRWSCICPNGGKPIGGMIFIDPCCRVHYAEASVPQVEPEHKITKEELAEWTKLRFDRRKKRVSYPKMTVAKA